jgi:hypothetical protein
LVERGSRAAMSPNAGFWPASTSRTTRFRAHYVEALWALDQPPGALDVKAMLRDTLAAPEQLLAASTRFRKNLPPRAHPRLAQPEVTVRQSLLPAEAYSMVPGRDPQTG